MLNAILAHTEAIGLEVANKARLLEDVKQAAAQRLLKPQQFINHPQFRAWLRDKYGGTLELGIAPSTTNQEQVHSLRPQAETEDFALPLVR